MKLICRLFGHKFKVKEPPPWGRACSRCGARLPWPRCVGWLVDDPGYVGGAELTQAEFRQAAPDDAEIVDCPAGNVQPGLDRYVCGNVPYYTEDDVRRTGSAPVVKYVHDVWPFDGGAREWLCVHARLIFCSPLHEARFPHPYSQDAEVIPPALDLDRFASNGKKRSGTCSVAGWRAPSKGGQLLREWSDTHGPVDVYGDGPFVPSGPNLNEKGPVSYDQLPKILARYERFVFLPMELEPFCRSVVEAWAAGLQIVTNGLVGGRYWIEEKPEALETAATDFWELVLNA